MAVWEIVRDAFAEAAAEGKHWLTGRDVIRRVTAAHGETNHVTIRLQIGYHCINDPLRKHSNSKSLRNPLFVTDDPSMRGKRYRLLTGGERAAFLAEPRDDLEFASYARVAEWLAGGEPPTADEAEEARSSDGEDDAAEDTGFAGLALFELHLQDYLHRHWAEAFPGLALHGGDEGREFVTRDPSVGILDFLARDTAGDWVVVETKRARSDRQAVGQVLSYMGWVRERLCAEGESVRGVLIVGEVSDGLRMAVAAAPGLEVRRYEMSFRLHAAGEAP